LILDTDGMKPIYVQIAEWLETEILGENIPEEERIYSQYQLAEMFNINPATAAKGLNILADEGILFKKRGLGMFVSPGARESILKKRRVQNLDRLLVELVRESERLGIDDEEIIRMYREIRQKEGKE
jgi:GntR family transcriptional regulator